MRFEMTYQSRSAAGVGRQNAWPTLADRYFPPTTDLIEIKRR